MCYLYQAGAGWWQIQLQIYASEHEQGAWYAWYVDDIIYVCVCVCDIVKDLISLYWTYPLKK